ncbi:Oidioi.mRNA.OKI2018_I69.chr2.g7237.t1.cds [Oikopleura dioica]|uniref:Oidioi.mRNA.OKI2018_I69.chr2.g7237.t1.cds n=1 Tax=Oikopleura dioica TaxID=34765 RepID=A0ABN7T6I0_OIKDI|nr:Oidioi.mRNA.OKI2018_I69.chr2.g7237.t1.cds [Oikopleura dioica]
MDRRTGFNERRKANSREFDCLRKAAHKEIGKVQHKIQKINKKYKELDEEHSMTILKHTNSRNSMKDYAKDLSKIEFPREDEKEKMDKLIRKTKHYEDILDFQEKQKADLVKKMTDLTEVLREENKKIL